MDHPNRSIKLYLIVNKEYSTCHPDDPMVDFYLDILDKLWHNFSDYDVEYVNKWLSEN